MKRTRIADALKRTDFGAEINVKGWVRSKRGSKGIFFVAMNDGSTIKNVQVVGDDAKFSEDTLRRITTGACLSVTGTLVESPAAGQASEIQATAIEVLGDCDNTYPLQKKGASWEYLRTVAHLRPRTNTFGAVFRIRHNMAMAIHSYFHQHGFYYFHTPLITASDCEGAGQMFQVTTKIDAWTYGCKIFGIVNEILKVFQLQRLHFACILSHTAGAVVLSGTNHNHIGTHFGNLLLYALF